MLDQSFSVNNFRKIFDYENRKGRYLEGMFFPTLVSLDEKLKVVSKQIKALSKENLNSIEYRARKERFNTEKNKLKEEKESLLIWELEKIADFISSNGWRLDIKKGIKFKGKDTYTTNKNDEISFFISKQLQYNVRNTYKVKQSGRYHIVSQLKDIIKNDFPKYIIRTDISSFYESIDISKLLPKLKEDTLLSVPSKKIISDILHQYKTLSKNDKGIPRGIGISAYLAEIYMREFDRYVELMDDVIFYSRYVDDIIVVFAPSPNSNKKHYLDKIKTFINSKLALKLNEGKTKEFDNTGAMDYLGYEFNIGNKAINIGKKKVEKYKKKIDTAFDEYAKRKLTNLKKARSVLIKRIKYLTGNTKLLDHRTKVLIGVYFSNSLLDNASSLNVIERYFKAKISSLGVDSIITKINIFSFIDGFDNKIYYNFSLKDLSDITKVWSYEA